MNNLTSFLSKLSSKFLLPVILLLSATSVAEVSAGPIDAKDWSIVATYTIPGKASGLAWDGTYIYFGIYGANGDHVYKFNPTNGTNELLFTSTALEDAFGMTWDGSNLWITDHANSSSLPAYAMKFDMSGNVISQFNLPDHYMSGIAYDNGNFWAATYYPNPGTIYKLDNTGAILDQIPSPNAQPWDLCMQGSDLWVADYDGNTLYKIDPSGTILESHACENLKPAGVVFDGQYLWYVDGELSSNSTLYKVNLSGAGTPQIEVPLITYNYGNVTLGDSAVWYCDVNSTGTADLVITNLIIQNAVPIFVWMGFPQTITPGGSIQIPFIYKPTEPIPLDTWIIIESNDPVSPQVTLQVTGEAVYDGPHINVPNQVHNYNDVRLNATTRWFLEIQNDGGQTLQVTDISITDDNFYLDQSVTFPISVNVLESAYVGIWFQPDEAIVYNGYAQISHNDITQGNIQVNLQGTGIDEDYPMGELLWNFTITTSWDNSIKGISPIGDVSGDGVDDVVVCSEDDFVRCFNGNSSGTSDILWENEAGSLYAQNDICIPGDLNGDGFDDAVIGFAWGVRAVKAFSGKTGVQLWIYDTHEYGDGGWVYQVSGNFDYNSDGINDILAATGNDGNNTGPKRIFCLNGISGEVLWDTYTDGPNFGVIGVEDFTGDSTPDAIGGASNNGETEGKVYGIDGADGSITFTYTTSGSSVWALEQLKDINNDGIKDIIAGDFGGHYYLIDPVSGNPVYSGNVGTSLLLRFERLNDVNGDGYPDIAIGHSGTNAVVESGFNGQNIWLTGLADKCWNIDRIDDVSGDGINDLVAGTLYSGNYCYFINGTNGDILFSQNYGEPVDGIAAIPDITGDGSWEMVVGGRNGKLYCYSGGLNSSILNADFGADTTYGHVPFDVQFTDLTSGNAISWQWDFENDGTIDSYDQNPVHTYSTIGTYSVKMIAGNGTVTDTALKINYIIADSTVGYSEVLSDYNIAASPNPFNKNVSIYYELTDNVLVQISIYNPKGEKVKSLQPIIYQSIGKYQVLWDGTNDYSHHVEQGLYFGYFMIGNNIKVIKLIKQ